MKNTHKISKKKLEATFRIEKKVFKKIVKNNYNVCGKFENNLLSGIKFEYKDNILKMISTDGNRLIVNEIETADGSGECQAVYNGFMLGKLNFLKNICLNFDGYIDYLQFVMTPDELKIWDVANNITYNVKAVESGMQYPEYEKLFPQYKKAEKGTYTSIFLNVNFVEELKRMAVNPRTNIVKLTFKNNSPLAIVTAESKDENTNTKSKTIIMPMQIKD